jgi:myosin heavy subunit
MCDCYIRPKGREACYFTRQDAGVKCWSEETVEESERGGGGGGTVLESACTHSVRVICSQLEETLSGSHSGGQSEVERKKGTEHSWRQIESLLTQHTPGEILSSLEEVTQQTTSHLHSHTLSIDLTRDAQHLKYSYDSQCGGMKDLAQQPSLLHAVEEQLLEAQLSHIRRSIESECARNAAGAARARAAELQTQALQLLQEMYRDLPDGQQEALELAKQLYTRLELECAGSAAALERLRSLCSSLDDARNQRRRAVTDLRNRLRKIQEFAQVAESKQKEIRALVAHNSSARDRLQTQYRELQRYVEQHVLGHHDELTRAARALRDSVAREVQAFSGLSLHRMLKPPSSQVPTCDLSINGLGRKQPSGHPSWAVVTRSLSLPPNAAPDRALAQLLAAQERVCRLEGNVSEVNQALQQMRLAAVNKDNTQDVLQRCKEHDSRLLETAIPALQECLSRASSGLADCERTAETLDHWWNQPAQFLTPWATQAGFSTQQWVDQWRVLTAKFSELQGLQY